ncbi:cell filamentation protein Fic [Spirochaetia bacterium]|nr:cell filamentation protein Fic [Spirochaetia bacterium]
MRELGSILTDTIWQTILEEIKYYKNLQLELEIDYQKFYLYSLITHSTAIEGSTLTELDTQLLFDDGITAKGKPLIHHLMNNDLKNAYTFAIECAKEKKPVTIDLLREFNAKVLKTTGSIYNVAGGSFDSSKGEFRLCGVKSGYGGTSYMDYKKASAKLNEFCTELQNKMICVESEQDRYKLSFDAHYNLVTIHPWADGNGRTARLVMNYIQFCYGLVPAKVYKEDKADYISALVDSDKNESLQPFRSFMATQLLKMLQEENGKNEIRA